MWIAAGIAYAFMQYYGLSIAQAVLVFMSFLPFKSLFELNEIKKFQNESIDDKYDNKNVQQIMNKVEFMDSDEMSKDEDFNKLLDFVNIGVRHIVIMLVSVFFAFQAPIILISGLCASSYFYNKKLNKFIIFITNAISFCVILATIFFL